MIKAKLIVVGGDAKRTEVALKQLPATIGRARDASVTLPHSLVSRKHCEIFEENDQLFVRDLNSLNGTYLNSEKIDGAKILQPGQLLTLGNVTFRADYQVVAQPLSSDVGCEHDATAEFQKEDTIDAGFVNPAINDKDDTKPGDSAMVAGSEFVFEGVERPGEASVSQGAIQELPSAMPQASFAGHIDGEEMAEQVDANTVQIDLGDDRKDEIQPTNSSLNEFFRKMPK